MKKILLTVALMCLVFAVLAQGGRPNPGRRMQMEKDSVMAKIASLSDDQKMLIEAVYADAQTSMEKLIGTAQDDREGFRTQMRALAEDKNAQLKEILNEEQWQQYETRLKEARERRREQRGERGRGRGRRGNGG